MHTKYLEDNALATFPNKNLNILASSLVERNFYQVFNQLQGPAKVLM